MGHNPVCTEYEVTKTRLKPKSWEISLSIFEGAKNL